MGYNPSCQSYCLSVNWGGINFNLMTSLVLVGSFLVAFVK